MGKISEGLEKTTLLVQEESVKNDPALRFCIYVSFEFGEEGGLYEIDELKIKDWDEIN